MLPTRIRIGIASQNGGVYRYFKRFYFYLIYSEWSNNILMQITKQ